jgi:hypothetical protein
VTQRARARLWRGCPPLPPVADTKRTPRPGAILKADATTIGVKAEKDGKLRLTASAWAEPVVVLPGQIVEIGWQEGQTPGMKTVTRDGGIAR